MFLYKQRYLKENVEIRNSLSQIYGVGGFKSFLICAKLGFGFPYSIDNMNLYNYSLLVSILDELTWLEVRIRRMIFENVDKLLKIECYKGFRHRDLLPCRGQRTRTNAKSCKRQLRIN